jgi:AcrR family transcriptional regulator
MDNRERILQAAARVYAHHGFRGATTRLIAIEAGVNEVTLFRTFGSKAALFEAMMRSHCTAMPLPELPDSPADPQAELTDWCAALLGQMRQSRSMIRKSFGELEERPDAASSVCEGPNYAGMLLSTYVTRLQATGLADPSADVETAVAMFMSTMFGDTIARDVMPSAFPQPVEDAAARYVRTFLRAIGVPASSARAETDEPCPDSPTTRRAAAQ